MSLAFAAVVSIAMLSSCTPRVIVMSPTGQVMDTTSVRQAQSRQAVASNAIPTDQTARARTYQQTGMSNPHPDIDFVLLDDPNKPDSSLAGKLSWDGSSWIKQIILYQGSAWQEISPEVQGRLVQHVRSLVAPNRAGARMWEPFGYWLVDKTGRTLAGRAADGVSTTAVPLARETAPVVAQNPGFQVRQENGQTIAVFQSDIFFDSGSATLKPGSENILRSFVNFYNQNHSGFHILIEGHTDNVPINTATFPNNFVLSYMRAIAVEKCLIMCGLQSQLYLNKGYGDTVPVATNSTPEGRQLNRRVQIRLVRPSQ